MRQKSSGRWSIGRGVLIACLGVLAALILYACFWPLKVQPAAYTASLSQGYTGPFAENDLLGNMEQIAISPYLRPEHIECHDGYLYASCYGSIIRCREDGSGLETVVETGGATLGFCFDSNDNLIFCDPMYQGETAGVYLADLSVSPAAVTLLCDEINGEPLNYPDAVTIGGDGTLYISDATAFRPLEYGGNDAAYNEEYWYHSGTGRVLAYHPGTGSGWVLAEGLSFANGLALSGDEQYLYICETNEFTIWKLSASAIQAQKGDPEFQPFLENLPGFPDNLTRGQDGRFWCGLTAPRSDTGDWIISQAFLRSVMGRFPFLMPSLEGADNRPHAFAFNESGQITVNLMADEAVYPSLTGVCETDNRLYFHANNSLGYIAYLGKDAVGLK